MSDHDKDAETRAPLKEDELHLWVELADRSESIELVMRFDEFEQLEIGFLMADKNQVFLLAPSQWKLLQAFIEHGQ